MKIKNILVASTLGVASLVGLPLLAGCNEEQIADLESQISTLQTEKEQLTIDKTNLQTQNTQLTIDKTNLETLNTQLTTDKTNLQNQNLQLQNQNDQLVLDKTNLQNQNLQLQNLINEATYQMLCSVMTQLPNCDKDSDHLGGNSNEFSQEEIDNAEDIYNSYITKTTTFNNVWNTIVTSETRVNLGDQYKVQYNDKWYVVKFTYNNGIFKAEMFSMVVTQDAYETRTVREFVVISSGYSNGNFSQVEFKNGKWVEVASTATNETSITISRINYNKSSQIPWSADTSAMNNDEKAYEGQISVAFEKDFDVAHTITLSEE